MNTQLLVAILTWATPIVQQILKDHRAASDDPTATLTDAEIVDIFNNNIDRYTSEWAAWRAQHPDA